MNTRVLKQQWYIGTVVVLPLDLWVFVCFRPINVSLFVVRLFSWLVYFGSMMELVIIFLS